MKWTAFKLWAAIRRYPMLDQISFLNMLIRRWPVLSNQPPMMITALPNEISAVELSLKYFIQHRLKTYTYIWESKSELEALNHKKRMKLTRYEKDNSTYFSFPICLIWNRIIQPIYDLDSLIFLFKSRLYS